MRLSVWTDTSPGSVAGGIDDLDLTRLDHEELEVAIADLEQRLSSKVPLERSAGAAPDLCELLGVERGEGELAQTGVGHV